MRCLALGLLASLAFVPTAVAAETVLVLDGTAPADGPDHFFVAFEVPAGIVEIEVQHSTVAKANILDWGLNDPAGFRGWGGGNSEPAIVGIDAASRSYVAGPIPSGTWQVVVGKAQVPTQPAEYLLTVILRDEATLPPQPERTAYVPGPGLGGQPRWYAGDFHVHSRESGDARPSLDELATFASSRGLDFIAISDHNTLTHLEFFADVQPRHPSLLLIPNIEFTTYAGHANAIGAHTWVDHKLGQPGVTISAAAEAFAAQGALLSINHPMLELGDVCIGCAWKHEIPATLAAVEVATSGLDKAGQFFTGPAIQYWEDVCATGLHVAAIGGSDDHRAGVDLGSFDSPVGDPTTLVYAESLSVPAVLAGVAAGRTVVKLQGPGDPMVELSSGTAMPGDTVTAEIGTVVEISARVTSAPAGASVRFVHNGQIQASEPVVGDDYTAVATAVAPADGEDRWRAEVVVEGRPRTITSYLWVRGVDGEATSTGPEPSTSSGPEVPTTTSPEPMPDASSSSGGPGDPGAESSGCGCTTTAPPSSALTLLALAGLACRRRRLYLHKR